MPYDKLLFYRKSEMKKLEDLKKEDCEAIKEFCALLHKGLGKKIRAIRLFGSKVKGNDTPDSDIDIFILLNENEMSLRDEILERALEVDLKYGVYISPRVFFPREMEDPVIKATPFISHLEEWSIPI